MGKLTATSAKSIAKPGRHGDGGTLYLCVKASGAKSWIQRITIDGRRHDIGLGSFPVVSLAKARERAFANRVAVADGRNPLADKIRARTPTFREAAEKTIEANRPRWRNSKTDRNWTATLDRHAFPVLGSMRVDRIDREDVLRVLTPLWTSRPEQARKLRRRIRATLAWCQAHGFVEHNIAGEVIDGALPAQPAVKQHLRSLPYREVADALATVHGSRASLAAKLCLHFTILTAVRSGETRGANWSEIDLDAREWRIPATRMKAAVEHRVPLSDSALAVLEQALPLRDGSDLVFPSPARRGRPLSDMALTKVLRDTGLSDRATVHGFRSSFRDWCAETGKPREIAEAALAHTVGGVEGAYFRSDLFERRRRLMADWARYLNGEGSTVVQLSG